MATALAQNPKIEGARARLQASSEGVAQARAGWFPSVAAHANSGLSTDVRSPSLTRSAQTASFDLLVTQPLLDGGRTASAVRSAKAGSEAERERARAVEQQIVLAGVTAYTDVLSNRRLTVVNKRNVTLLERTAAAARQQLAAREATRADVAQAEAALAGARAQVEQARANLAASAAAFEEALLHAPGNLAPPPAIEHLLPPSREQALALAEAEGSSVAIAQWREEAARHAVDQARAQRWPTIGLQAGYERTGGFDDFDNKGGLVARVVGTVPLFAAGTEADIRAAGHNHAAAASDVLDAKAQVRTAVAQSWSQIVASRAAIRSLEAQHAASRVALEGIVSERQLGQRTLAETIAAQQAVLTAETALEQTRRNLYVATCTVLLLTGRIDLTHFSEQKMAAWTADVRRHETRAKTDAAPQPSLPAQRAQGGIAPAIAGWTASVRTATR